MNLKNKKVLLVGLAKTGVSTIKHLNRLGAKVVVNDIKDKDKFSWYSMIRQPEFVTAEVFERAKEKLIHKNLLYATKTKCNIPVYIPTKRESVYYAFERLDTVQALFYVEPPHS